MIPVRLRLRNFMCYGENTNPIDLAGVELACLAGENGAGKSALLGAITWALWGQARDHVPDDELMRQGSAEMDGDLEFALGGHRYRVLRKRLKKGKTSTPLLHFDIGQDGAWKSLDGHSIADTEKRIVQTLHLDYDTFINSAFLLQGKADSFTVMSAADRKQLLGSILGLDAYDRYVEAARKRSRDAELLRKQLEGALLELERTIAARPTAEAELAQRTAEQAQAEQIVATAETDLAAIERAVREAEAQEARRQELARQQADDTGEADRLTGVLRMRDSRVAAFQTVLAERDVILERHAELLATRERERALAADAAEVRRLSDEIRVHERAIDRARNQLEIQAGTLEGQIPELVRRANERPTLEIQVGEARRAVAALAEASTRREQLQAQMNEKSQEIGALQGENKKLKEEMDRLRDKIDQLEAARADALRQSQGGGAETHCPLCSQVLDADAFARVLDSYQADGQTHKRQYLANRDRQAASQEEADRLKRDTAALDDQLRQQPLAQKRESQLEKSLDDAVAATAKLSSAEADAAAIRAQIAAGAFAAEARAGLHAAQARIAALAFDQGAYEEVRARLLVLEPFAARRSELAEAEKTLPAERVARDSDAARLTDIQRRLAANAVESERLNAALVDLPAYRARRETLLTDFQRARRTLADVADLRSRAQHQLEEIARAEAQRAERRKELDAAKRDKGLYDELQKAFGKSGIQAMIIEQVLPELEEEANTLLSRMTDGRMHLSIETQRQAKSTDGVIETLDIRISDEMGAARRYELFSGGEAFRINFAVRIALSKLLTRRAGAQLQTLVIDEGFGTQDGAGRERLIAAIRSIQPDFACILVITHIQELKDEFPTRIEVTRLPEGSQVVVG